MNWSEDASDGRAMSAGDDEKENFKPSVRSTGLRWLMLVFGCAFLMGSYYSYDIPASLSVYLGEDPYKWDSKQVALMYSVYSFPNMILPLFGGVLLDKIGIKVGLMLFTTVNTVG
jgi:MFS family permease